MSMSNLEHRLRSLRESVAGDVPKKKFELTARIVEVLEIDLFDDPEIYRKLIPLEVNITRMRTMRDRLRIDRTLCSIINTYYGKRNGGNKHEAVL